MSQLHLVLLGGFEVQVGGSALTIVSRKSRALLAYLAISGSRPHARDALAALLWGDVPTDQSRQSLRKTLWDLRQALACARPSPLVTDGESVRLIPETVDVREFEVLVQNGQPDALRRAAELYRGDLLEGFRVDELAFEQWLTRQRARLHQLAVQALDRLLAQETDAGRVEAAVEVGLRLLAVNPLHEAAHRSLIRHYARQGRRDAALRQYRLCADALWRELQAKPEPETERAYREVLTGSTGVGWAGRPRILVAEDEVITQELLRELLAHAGYEVTTAMDGADALFQLSRASFDLVLADIWMPLLDGVKLLQVVRDKRADIPVIILTGRRGDPELEAACLALGAADYVTKPFHGQALLARVDKALRRTREERET